MYILEYIGFYLWDSGRETEKKNKVCGKMDREQLDDKIVRPRIKQRS